MPISTIPEFPAIGGAGFNSMAYAYATHMRTTWRTEVNTLETNVNAKEASAVAQAAAALASQIAAAASAASAAAYDNATGTSTTNMLMSVAAGKAFTTQAGKSWVGGMPVIAYNSAGNYMICTVASYVGTTLTLDCTAFAGTGTFASWSIYPPAIQRANIFGTAGIALDAVSGSEVISTSQTTTIAGDRIYSNGSLFVRPGDGNTVVSVETSPNGSTWTTRTLSGLGSKYMIASDGSGFLAVDPASVADLGAGHNTCSYSAGGTSWAAGAALPDTGGCGTNFSSAFNTFAAVPGKFLTRGRTTTTTMFLTVNNATSWTTETAPAASMGNLAGSNGVFVLWTNGSATYWTSTTGTTGSWTSRTMPGSLTNMVKDINGDMIAYGSAGNAYRSTDGGINWTSLGYTLTTAPCSIEGVVAVQGASTTWSTRHKSGWMNRTWLANATPSGHNIAKVGTVYCVAASGLVWAFDAAVGPKGFFG